MAKQEAVAIFGSQTALAEALGITPSAVSQWPDILTTDRADRVRGAALRLGKKIKQNSRTALESAA